MKMKLWLIGLSALFSVALFARDGKDEAVVYVFGYSTSFSDSTIVLTAVQPLRGATLEAKTKFLSGREAYSYQLQSYLESRNPAAQTCAVFFNKKRAKLEKKYVALRNRIKANKNVKLVELDAATFAFTPLVQP